MNQALGPHLRCTLQVKEAQMADPVDFLVKQLPYDLSSHGGLALVGRLFKRINLPALVDPKYPVHKAARIISHARGWVLGISGSDSGFAVFERAFGKMKTA